MRNDSARKIIVDRLQADLVGPLEAEEVISDLPSDRYLTGILFPPKTAIGADQADEAEVADDDPDGASGIESSSLASTFRPSAAGLSFTVRTGGDGIAAARFDVAAGRYVQIGAEPTSLAVAQSRSWQRVPLRATFEELLDPQDLPHEVDLGKYGIPGLRLHLRIKRWQDFLLVTAALVNSHGLEEHTSRDELEEHTFFQVSLSVSPILGGKLVPKPITRAPATDDVEAAISSLIYRDAEEYAVGHTCSADWVMDGTTVSAVRTQWLPGVVVKKSVETGDVIFDALRQNADQLPLNTRWLSEADQSSLIAGLKRVSALYGKWIEAQENDLEKLEDSFVAIGRDNLQTCTRALDRIEAGISLIEADPDVRTAFQLANRAIWLQSRWKSEKQNGATDLSWRPFQLAFVLLCLGPTANADDEHRDTMDLLWFPTGGGKTEAYLLLTAFVVFLRRLRANGDPSGAGVTAFMRYTLRLLTIQQFQRAAALVVACDLIRRGAVDVGIAKRPGHFDTDPPISIGLWVGDGSTPNKVPKAIEALENNSPSTPKQLSRCPVCDSELSWGWPEDRGRILVHCREENCCVGKLKDPLPIWTVDEDIYREKPTLVIGTADKYVQLPRNKDTGLLFGIGSNVGPPDLIIQDELHLISGPLGTMAGLYEIAIDELSSRGAKRPKIIGSTATIRRAESQIRALFNRAAFQFPPPGLDHANSGFATLDKTDPGRLCVGVTTTGRSAKFTLQAVAASILQSATSNEIPDGARDEYATLVTYFNSLRELGGALVLMRDDVDRSISEYAARREGEEARQLRPPVELTSRVTSSEIPGLLGRLDLDFRDDDSVDAVLATNMISVGVDVSRLGAMIVNGQPKGIAEYIQASSRVGRSKVPGLVVTVYNANKARDRSRYETFAGWHQSLYRDVEATSVTPFAPRARDRAIHAVLVAIVRHTIHGMSAEPIVAADHETEIRAVIDRIVQRARDVDEEEAHAVGQALHEFLERWIARGRIKYYWNDQSDEGLLISAEKAAERALERRSARWATPSPNSLRSVEPSSAFVLTKEHLPRRDQ
ncbi:helicase-related protein [Agrobacterium genomosp. 2]|uniref:DNA helicase n=1 Tax=Agrobacterium genomosp. 2 str. CFBP 5494 TaxID=1183436 RepID=A0A9W5F380_9HYPH|nr:helicase-related protein [Agrobacterium genomosp. 2]CUW93654.1 DNA helicase [Agrobacterium genomosp. 2 str. CFBP 5494]